MPDGAGEGWAPAHGEREVEGSGGSAFLLGVWRSTTRPRFPGERGGGRKGARRCGGGVGPRTRQLLLPAIVAPPLLPAPIVSSGGTAQSTALECIAVEVIDQARRSKGWAKGVATARILGSS